MALAGSFFPSCAGFSEGLDCSAAPALAGGASSFGISMEERSSPSSARTAMICPTGILEDPAWTCQKLQYQEEGASNKEAKGREGKGREGKVSRRRRTRILPRTPSSCASTSMVALSVSYSHQQRLSTGTSLARSPRQGVQRHHRKSGRCKSPTHHLE